jgi:F-box/leucine-rich repeat protein 10/11
MTRLCWYVADRYCSDLRQCRAYRPRAMTTLSPPHHVVLEGLVHLANFLIAQTDILENDEEEDKKRSLIFNKIPSEIVKDPSGLARELLWRVHRELRHSGVKEECAALAPPTESITPRRATSSQSSQVNAAKTHRPPKTSRHPAVSRIANFEPV